jgi:hypothetical protein
LELDGWERNFRLEAVSINLATPSTAVWTDVLQTISLCIILESTKSTTIVTTKVSPFTTYTTLHPISLCPTVAKNTAFSIHIIMS